MKPTTEDVLNLNTLKDTKTDTKRKRRALPSFLYDWYNKTNVVPFTGSCSIHEAMFTSSDS